MFELSHLCCSTRWIQGEDLNDSEPTLLVFPGWGLDESLLLECLTALAPRIQAVSFQWSSHWRVSQQQSLVSLMHSLPESTVLLGWSLGAAIALQLRAQLASGQPLISIAANLQFTASAQWPCAMANHTFLGFQSQIKRQAITGLVKFSQLVAAGSSAPQLKAQLRRHTTHTVDSNALLEGLFHLCSLNNYDALHTQSPRTLFIFGRQDALVPVSAATAVQQRFQQLPQIDISVIEHACHALFLDQAKASASCIRHWLQKTQAIQQGKR